MALSAKLWPFSSLSNEKIASPGKSSTFLPRTTSMNSALFSYSTADEEILEQLNSTDFELRLRTLNRLRNLALGHELWFKRFSKKLELFKSFSNVLSDSNWEVQHQCIKFLTDTIRDYGQDLEWCVAIIWPHLLPKLASPKITVRRICVQCLVAYVKHVDGVHAFQKALIQYGLAEQDKNITKEVLKEMPSLFVSEFRVYNWSILTEGLVDYLCGLSIDREISDLVLTVLEKLLNLVGQHQFNNYVQTLAAGKKTRYEELLLERRSVSFLYAHNGRINTARALARFNPTTSMDDDEELEDELSDSSLTGPVPNAKQFRYGVIPVTLVNQLNSETNWQIRYDGLEKLKTLIEAMKEADMKKLQPHLFSYINLLSNILDDLNIKNIILTLDILRESVVKMRRHVEPHLQHIIAAMAKHLGNQKAIIKQLNLTIVLELMRQLNPKPVFAVLCGYLQHRNSRVREEVLNIVTVALLTHPGSNFNISAVAHIISPLLADGKRRVRLASFECAAVLANCVGAGKVDTILKHVREVEETRNAPGLIHAVQSRLNRNQLPKIRSDGLLEYASFSVSPSGDERRNFSEASSVSSADIEWIMSASIGQGSAVSRSLSPIRFRATTSLDKQQSITSIVHDQRHTPAPVRRVFSAGRNLRKLPSENGYDERVQQEVDRVYNRSSSIKPNESPSNSDNQQRTPPRPAKLLDHLSNTDNQPKNGTVGTKHNAQTSNGKPVLSLLEASKGSNEVPFAGKLKSPPLEEESETKRPAVGRKPRNFKREDAQERRAAPDHEPSSIRKTQSVSTLVNVTSVGYKNSWDETPIKPASREQLQAYFGDAITTTARPINGPTTTVDSEKQTPVEVIKAVVEGRRSSVDSSDLQQMADTPVLQSNSTGIRKPPLLAKRISLKKPMNGSVSTNRSPPLARKMHSDSNSEASSDVSIGPCPNPQQALTAALKKLSSDEWKSKLEGISTIERLARFNSSTLADDIQPVIIALNGEVRNLRSSVSKQALKCYCHLFEHLKRSMDQEVERVCTVLMAKTGDTSNAFTREGATKALESMVDHVSPQRSLVSLVATGARHKSAIVRTACSQLMLRLVKNMGAAKALSSPPEFVEKILITASNFANDTQQQTRYQGKAILATLSQDPEFSRTVSRCLSESQQRTVLNVVDTVKSKGLGSSLSSSGTLSLHGSASSDGRGAGRMGRNSSVRRKTKLSEEALDTFLAAQKELTSTSWEERLLGVKRVIQLSQSHPKTLGDDVKLMETYMGRLNDINGKVAAQSLQSLPCLLTNVAPHLGEVVRPVATEVVKHLSAQLPSKNDDIRRMAQDGLDCAVEQLDNSALIQPLGIAVKSGNVRQKPDLLKRLGNVSENIFATKPKLVQMHSLPVLYELVKTHQMDHSLRQSVVEYARVLARLVGVRTLIEAATVLSPDQKRELEDMLV